VGYQCSDNCPAAVPTNYSHMFFEDEDEEEVCAVLSTKYPSSIGSNLPCHLVTTGGGVHEKVPNRVHCA